MAKKLVRFVLNSAYFIHATSMRTHTDLFGRGSKKRKAKKASSVGNNTNRGEQHITQNIKERKKPTNTSNLRAKNLHSLRTGCEKKRDNQELQAWKFVNLGSQKKKDRKQKQLRQATINELQFFFNSFFSYVQHLFTILIAEKTVLLSQVTDGNYFLAKLSEFFTTCERDIIICQELSIDEQLKLAYDTYAQ